MSKKSKPNTESAPIAAAQVNEPTAVAVASVATPAAAHEEPQPMVVLDEVTQQQPAAGSSDASSVVGDPLSQSPIIAPPSAETTLQPPPAAQPRNVVKSGPHEGELEWEFEVISPLDHDNKFYAVGDPVWLPVSVAERLIGRSIKAIDDE